MKIKYSNAATKTLFLFKMFNVEESRVNCLNFTLSQGLTDYTTT